MIEEFRVSGSVFRVSGSSFRVQKLQLINYSVILSKTKKPLRFARPQTSPQPSPNGEGARKGTSTQFDIYQK